MKSGSDFWQWDSFLAIWYLLCSQLHHTVFLTFKSVDSSNFTELLFQHEYDHVTDSNGKLEYNLPEIWACPDVALGTGIIHSDAKDGHAELSKV